MTTLLELTQDILAEMDGDEVNSISDTVEAEQVVTTIKIVYENIMSNRNWPHTRRTVTVQGRGDTNFPSHMILDNNCKELISISYNKRKLTDTRTLYRPVKYMDPDEFLMYTNKRNSDNSDTLVVIDDSGAEILIQTSKAPDYFTSFDETNIVFDSYDNEVDTTLQGSKIQALGYTTPTFLRQDDFEFDLPREAIPSLREEAVSRAQFKYRQFQDVKSEQEAMRQRRWGARKSWRVGGGTKYPDFGRKR